MKKLLIAFMIAVSGISMVVADAEARRLGGGGTFGRQAPAFSRPAPKPALPQQQTIPNRAQQPGATNTTGARPAASSPWRGIFGSALLGLGLGALLAQFGIGGALANLIAAMLMIVLFVLAATVLYRLLRGRQSRVAYAGHHAHHYADAGGRAPEIGSRAEPQLHPAAFESEVRAGVEAAHAPLPRDFDEAEFVRHAKSHFIRLQSAWDRADVADIREFTTPEMFAELRMQLQERGPSPNYTDVVSLDAEVLGVETEGAYHMASVRFSGLIREAEGADPEAFSEIWNLVKPVAGDAGWLLAGIQQVS